MSYSLLSQLDAPATLCPQLRTILLACGHVAAGDAAATVAAFNHIARAHRPKAYELALVQSAPLIGVPRVLHSAAALQAAGTFMGPPAPSPFPSSPSSPSPSTSAKLPSIPAYASAGAAPHVPPSRPHPPHPQQHGRQPSSPLPNADLSPDEFVPPQLLLPDAPSDPDALREAGQRVFDAVYARNSGRVQRRLHTMHPELCDWIMSCVYGRLLSRNSDANRAACGDRGGVSNGAESVQRRGDGAFGDDSDDRDDEDTSSESAPHSISLRERELAIVASLCVDPVAAVQLASHLRGALNAGATGAEIEAVVRQTRLTRADSAESAEAVFATFRRARYAL